MVFSQPQHLVPQPVVDTRYSAILLICLLLAQVAIEKLT